MPISAQTLGYGFLEGTNTIKQKLQHVRQDQISTTESLTTKVKISSTKNTLVFAAENDSAIYGQSDSQRVSLKAAKVTVTFQYKRILKTDSYNPNFAKFKVQSN